MSPRRIQFFLMLGICFIGLHFTIRFGADCAEYLSLNQREKAKILEWEIVPVKDRFAIQCKYEFESQGKTWVNSSRLLPPYFLNEWAALESLKDLAKNKWNIWFNSDHPEKSELEKAFPYSLLFRTLICYVVLIYFFYLYKKPFLV